MDTQITAASTPETNDAVVAARRLNHIVLWVGDADAAATFYEQALGLTRVNEMPGGVFMRAPGSPNDHDLGLFTTPRAERSQRRAVGMYHMAWEVPTLADLADRARKLTELGALVGASDHNVTKSLYAQDPDGIEFEIMWQVPTDMVEDDSVVTKPLDLDRAIEQYGANTLSRTLG